MKILLIVIGSLAVVAAVVVGMGLLIPKRHVVSRSASYRLGPEQLYPLIAGPQDWRPDVVRCDVVPDGSGRDLMRETTRDGETITYELLDRKPPTSIRRRIATQNLPYSGTWAFSLVPKDGVTVVRITEDGEVHNPVFRFVSHFVLGHTRTLDAYLRAMAKASGQEIQVED
jgi:hypothetical protein